MDLEASYLNSLSVNNEPKSSIVSGFVVRTQRMIAINYYNNIIITKIVWGWIRLWLISLLAIGFDGPLGIGICIVSILAVKAKWSTDPVRNTDVGISIFSLKL